MNNIQKVKRMDIIDFQNQGFLQEANRQFFHPLGLALEIVLNKNRWEAFWYYIKFAFRFLVKDNSLARLGGIWDYSDDPEGMLFSDSIMKTESVKEKAIHVEILRKEKERVRQENFGFVIQPIEVKENESSD